MNSNEKITIDSHTIEILPRYAETDQGGVIHHSVYPVWLEMGRTELLRANGINYRDLEAEGTFFVIAELSIKYRRPARYDQKLSLTTRCSRVTAARIEHSYEIKEPASGILIARARTVLACLDDKGTVRRVPEYMYVEE